MPEYIYTYKNMSSTGSEFFGTELFRIEEDNLFTLIEYTYATEVECLEHIKEWKAIYNPEALSDWRVRTFDSR